MLICAGKDSQYFSAKVGKAHFHGKVCKSEDLNVHGHEDMLALAEKMKSDEITFICLQKVILHLPISFENNVR